MEVCKDCDYGHFETGCRGHLCPIKGFTQPTFKAGCAGFVAKQADRPIPRLGVAPDRGVQGQGEWVLSTLEGVKGRFLAELTLIGCIRGGKNAVQITRTGHRYPNPVWAKWRDEMVGQITKQYKGKCIESPVLAAIAYYAGDRKRRDIPAILDSIWHCLEKSQVLADDCLVKSVYFTGDYDKQNPRAVVSLYELPTKEGK